MTDADDEPQKFDRNKPSNPRQELTCRFVDDLQRTTEGFARLNKCNAGHEDIGNAMIYGCMAFAADTISMVLTYIREEHRLLQVDECRKIMKSYFDEIGKGVRDGTIDGKGTMQ